MEMRIQNIFHPTRFYLLMRNGIVLNKSSILIMSAAFGGILLLLSAIDVHGGYRPRFHQGLYLGVLYLGVLIVTNRIFRDFHDPVKEVAWLLIPASLLEKVSSRIVLSTVMYVITTMLIYILFSFLSEGLNWLLFKRHHPVFNQFDQWVVRGVAIYFVLQAPLLVGAIYFQKHSLSKTILTLLGYTLVFFAIVIIAMWLILGNYFHGLLPGLETIMDQTGVINDATIANLVKLSEAAVWIWRIIFFVLIPPLCWTICYYRLKETER